MSIANTPDPPYYAVIFTATRTKVEDGYQEMVERMMELAKTQNGFLGKETVGENFEITVSYWKSHQAILNWRRNAEHKTAQRLGREKWYKAYKLRICKVERDYGFEK